MVNIPFGDSRVLSIEIIFSLRARSFEKCQRNGCRTTEMIISRKLVEHLTPIRVDMNKKKELVKCRALAAVPSRLPQKTAVFALILSTKEVLPYFEPFSARRRASLAISQRQSLIRQPACFRWVQVFFC